MTGNPPTITSVAMGTDIHIEASNGRAIVLTLEALTEVCDLAASEPGITSCRQFRWLMGLTDDRPLNSR